MKQKTTIPCSRGAEHNDSAACGMEKLYGYQDGIVETVRLVLEEAADGHEAITPNIAGALGLKLRAASGWYSPMDSRRTSLANVARILLAAAQEKLNLSPVLAGVFASLLAGASTCTNAVRSASLADDKANKANEANEKTTASSPCSRGAEHNHNTACGDEIITVSGYYTPEEAEALIEKIRDWLSGCRDVHSLADLMESIKRKFQLFDSQLGELLGISDRLVGHVRHGRPSPFAKARFVEVFGTAGGADADRG